MDPIIPPKAQASLSNVMVPEETSGPALQRVSSHHEQSGMKQQ